MGKFLLPHYPTSQYFVEALKGRYDSAGSTTHGVHVLPLMLMLHRTKNILVGLLAVVFAFFSPSLVFASPAGISYRISLGHDLDGDRLPETARIRQSGDVYKISIYFSSGRPRLHLTVYEQEDAAGLSFAARDIDDDRDQDLVLTSATSFRPVAVWLNSGKAKFKKVSSWAYSGPHKFGGPSLNRRAAYTPESDVAGSSDPLAHAEKVIQQFDVDLNIELLRDWNREQLPGDSFLQQVPARGPPH